VRILYHNAVAQLGDITHDQKIATLGIGGWMTCEFSPKLDAHFQLIESVLPVGARTPWTCQARLRFTYNMASGPVDTPE